MGQDFWQPLMDFIETRLVQEAVVDPADPKRFTVTDSVEEAVTVILDAATRRPAAPALVAAYVLLFAQSVGKRRAGRDLLLVPVQRPCLCVSFKAKGEGDFAFPRRGVRHT